MEDELLYIQGLYSLLLPEGLPGECPALNPSLQSLWAPACFLAFAAV